MMILFTYEVDIALRNVSWKSIVIDNIFQDRERTIKIWYIDIVFCFIPCRVLELIIILR